MKRFGNGWAFYGERETLKDKNYEEIGAQIEEAANFRPERPDSVLLLGATGELGNWITLKVGCNVHAYVHACGHPLFGASWFLMNVSCFLGQGQHMHDAIPHMSATGYCLSSTAFCAWTK